MFKNAIVEDTKGTQGLHEPFAVEPAYKSMHSALSNFQRCAQRFPPLTSDERNAYVTTYKTLIKQIDDLDETGKAKSVSNAKE